MSWLGGVGAGTRRRVPAVVLLGLLAGCASTTAGHGTPEAVPAPGTATAPGLPVPDDPAAPATTSAPRATTPPTPPRTTPAGRPCPADVAATLPGGAQPATLVAGFRTTRFRLYYCRTAGGRLYYRGISRADATKATTLPARTIPGGYEARTVVDGDVYVYRVAQRRLVVTENGKQIVVDPVTATL